MGKNYLRGSRRAQMDQMVLGVPGALEMLEAVLEC